MVGFQRDWQGRWKRANCVPWHCSLCNCENRYKLERCTQCGKTAPETANLRIEDAAATIVQCLVRRFIAFRRLQQQAASVIEKTYDSESGEVYYRNIYTHQTSFEKPRFIKGDINMDERVEIQYNEFIRDRKNKNRLKDAMEDRNAKRKVEQEKKRNEEADRIEAERLKQWNAPFIAAERTGELVANWKDFTFVDPYVLELGPSLTLLRMIGNPFVRLESELFHCLTQIVTIGISNCQLVELPDSITSLSTLQDLNIMKNELTELPERFGDLENLCELHLASNKLKALPLSFSQLKKLPRLNLEQNCIHTFPANITELKCHIVSWSKLNLRQIPPSIGDMGATLVSLTADHNRLKRIPRSIGKLTVLEHLSLCDNQIKLVPDDICKCVSLKRLWLDWNKVSELPPDFLNLTKLESIHLEGNPMKIPEMDIIVAGIPRLRAWFVESVDFYRTKERRAIVQHIQSILGIFHQEKKHLPEYFEPGKQCSLIGEQRDLYYAIIPSYLYEQVIPQWNEYVGQLLQDPELADALLKQYNKRKRKAEQKEREQREAEEKKMDGVLVEGAAAMEEDEEEEEEESESEDEDDDDATRAARKLKKLEKKKKQQILSELNKELDSIGSKHKKGDLQAEAMHLIEKVQKVLAPFEYTEEETKDALENFEDAYGKVAIDDQPANFRRCRCMENGHRRVCVPPDPEFRCERKALFIKIRLTTHMEKIKRDSLNREQEALEERLAVVEAQTREFCGTREGVIFFKNLAHDQAHILLEFERKEKYVLKKQLKLKRQKAYEERSRYKRREKLIQSRQLRIKRLEKQKRKLLAKLDRCQGWEAKECKDQILDIDDELENHPQDIELEIIETDQEIADAKFRKKAKPKQILSRYTPLGTIEESLLELTTKRVKKRSAIVFYKLIEAYVEAERRRVGLEIRDEFRITRKIMYNWMNLNVKMTFFAWRVMARRQIYWRRHFEIEEESQRMLDDQAAEVDAFYKQLERDKWEEFVDPFSDKTFWKHNETQEVVWVEPQLQDMIFVPRFRLLKTN